MLDENHRTSWHDERTPDDVTRLVHIEVGQLEFDGELWLPIGARGIVIFAQGSGSSRTSPRNRFVARVLQRQGIATLLFDTLMPAERRQDALDQRLRFDVSFMARRLALVTDWLRLQGFAQALPIGYFGARTGAAVAMVAAAERPSLVRALVSRGGRPDLAGAALERLHTPTLLLVEGEDSDSLRINELAMHRMPPSTQLVIVPDAGHLFEEPGALAMVSKLAGDWFVQHLAQSQPVIAEDDANADHRHAPPAAPPLPVAMCKACATPRMSAVSARYRPRPRA